MPIQLPGYQPALIGNLAKALDMVHTYYGINTEKQKQALQEHALNLQDQNDDLSSPITEGKQSALGAAIAKFKNQKGISPEESGQYEKLSGLIPKMSGTQIDAFNETNTPLKMYVAEQQALGQAARAGAYSGTKLQIHAEDVANKDPDILMSQQRLNGVLRVGDILKKVESGELKDTNQIKNAIGNEYMKLEAGTNSSGLGMAERSSLVNTLRGDANDLATRITGAIHNGAISPDQMTQLKGEIGTMANSYMEQFDQRHETLRNGVNDDELKTIDSKVNGLRKNLASRFGYWNGLQKLGKAPTIGFTGQNDSASNLNSQDQQAIAWAKQNPKDPRASQILQLHGM